jgi:Ca2+-binding EF-hand superfamily protein
MKPIAFLSTAAVSVLALVVSTGALAGDQPGNEGLHQGQGHAVPASAAAELQMMDTDRNGEISEIEHANGAKAMFEAMDVDKDAYVSAKEMDSAHKGRMSKDEKAPTGKMSSAEKIAVIDTNKDGKLSATEHADGSRRMFATMDKNQDGSLTRAELEAGRKTMLSSKEP